MSIYSNASPRPWAFDTEPNEDAEYGSGPNPSRGFDDFMILAAEGGKILGTENATHKLIEEDGPDEDGYVSAWDAIGKANAELIIHAVNNVERVEALNSDLLAAGQMLLKAGDEGDADMAMDGYDLLRAAVAKASGAAA